MLLVPFIAGVILRVKEGAGIDIFLAPLFACWLLGYFTFNAVSLWFKSAAKHRPALVAPAVTYGALTAMFGLTALWLAGPALAWWVVAFTPLLAPTLVLVARHEERSLASGLLTTAAASLMTVVTRFPDPTAIVGAFEPAKPTLWATFFVFAYFAGTVFYVKTNLRERDNHAFYVVSALWHLAALVGAIGTGVLGGSWSWMAFFAVALARALVVPKLKPARTPLQIGTIEIVLSVALCVAFAIG